MEGTDGESTGTGPGTVEGESESGEVDQVGSPSEAPAEESSSFAEAGAPFATTPVGEADVEAGEAEEEEEGEAKGLVGSVFGAVADFVEDVVVETVEDVVEGAVRHVVGKGARSFPRRRG